YTWWEQSPRIPSVRAPASVRDGRSPPHASRARSARRRSRGPSSIESKKCAWSSLYPEFRVGKKSNEHGAAKPFLDVAKRSLGRNQNTRRVHLGQAIDRLASLPNGSSKPGPGVRDVMPPRNDDKDGNSICSSGRSSDLRHQRESGKISSRAGRLGCG